MLFVPRQVALAASSHPRAATAAAAAVAMAKEEPKKEKKSKSKGKAAVKGTAAAAAAGAPDARAAVVASVAAFLEAGGFSRTLAALQSEANLETGAWRSCPVSLEDLVSKFLESSNSEPVAVIVGSNDQVADGVTEDVGKEKKKKKKKDDDSSAGNAGSVEAKETVKGDDQKLDGKKKKSKKQEKDDVEDRLEKVELAINKRFEAAEKLKENDNNLRKEEQKSRNADGNGALDKAKKKKKGKSASETSEKIDAGAAPAEADGAKGKNDAVETVKDDNEKKAKKKRKKSESEENIPVEGKEVTEKDLFPKQDDTTKSGMDIEEGETGRSSSDNAVVGKKRKLEEVEGSNPSAKENSTANQNLSNGFTEDNSKENSTISKPSKRQKQSSEPKTVNAFQRVKLENVKFADERLQDNSYWAKGGADSGYGAKAQEVLGQVRGRGFRHEKTKKKRGTYKGGQIDLQTHSIKFENSDDE